MPDLLDESSAFLYHPNDPDGLQKALKRPAELSFEEKEAYWVTMMFISTSLNRPGAIERLEETLRARWGPLVQLDRYVDIDSLVRAVEAERRPMFNTGVWSRGGGAE